MFVVADAFYKDLVVEVVQELGNKHMDVPHYLKYIQALRKICTSSLDRSNNIS